MRVFPRTCEKTPERLRRRLRSSSRRRSCFIANDGSAPAAARRTAEILAIIRTTFANVVLRRRTPRAVRNRFLAWPRGNGRGLQGAGLAAQPVRRAQSVARHGGTRSRTPRSFRARGSGHCCAQPSTHRHDSFGRECRGRAAPHDGAGRRPSPLRRDSEGRFGCSPRC